MSSKLQGEPQDRWEGPRFTCWEDFVLKTWGWIVIGFLIILGWVRIWDAVRTWAATTEVADVAVEANFDNWLIGETKTCTAEPADGKGWAADGGVVDSGSFNVPHPGIKPGARMIKRLSCDSDASEHRLTVKFIRSAVSLECQREQKDGAETLTCEARNHEER